MSPVQSSIISIIGEIKKRHQSFVTLQADKAYRVWLKHVRRKREFEAELKRQFVQQERERKLELEAAPKYF